MTKMGIDVSVSGWRHVARASIALLVANLVLLIFLTEGVVAQGNGGATTISGQVVNGTEGAMPPAELTVLLW